MRGGAVYTVVVAPAVETEEEEEEEGKEAVGGEGRLARAVVARTWVAVIRRSTRRA